MAQLFGLARIGRDVELRQAGTDMVANISLAFSYGKKGADNKRPTQWVDASIWGKRAEALAPYLLKGGLVSVTLEDVCIETYQGKNGEASKLVGRVSQIELAGGGQAQPAQQAAPTHQPQRQVQQKSGGFPNQDDDIHF